MAYVDNRPKVRIKFLKQNGQTRGSVLEPVPADWPRMSDIRKRAWAQHVAESVHPGATFEEWEIVT